LTKIGFGFISQWYLFRTTKRHCSDGYSIYMPRFQAVYPVGLTTLFYANNHVHDCKMKSSKKKKETKKRNFDCSYLRIGCRDLLQIWHVGLPIWWASQRIWLNSDKRSQSYIGLKMTFSFYQYTYSVVHWPCNTLLCVECMDFENQRKSCEVAYGLQIYESLIPNLVMAIDWSI